MLDTLLTDRGLMITGRALAAGSVLCVSVSATIVVALYYQGARRANKKAQREKHLATDKMFTGIFLSTIGLGVLQQGYWAIWRLAPLDSINAAIMLRFSDFWSILSLLAVLGYMKHISAIFESLSYPRYIMPILAFVLCITFVLGFWFSFNA